MAFNLPYAPDSGDEYIPPKGLVENDPTFTSMDIAWRVNEQEGELIGKHTHLKTLQFCDIYTIPKEDFEACMRGVAKNRSIEELSIVWCNGMWGKIFHILMPFFEKNQNLRSVNFDYCESLGAKPEEMMALVTLLRRCNNISLESILSIASATRLIPALSSLRQLKRLDLGHNEIGCPWVCLALADLLQDPSSALETLSFEKTFIGDDDLEVLADALVGNNVLKHLDLIGNEKLEPYEPANEFTELGWGYLARALCDTSSINQTYLSNHTLERVYPPHDPPEGNEMSPLPPAKVLELLAMNSDSNKKRVATKKILSYHREFDMKPFFEWEEFEVLPFVVKWFDDAKESMDDDMESVIDTRKLGSIYQFARGMPEEMGDSYTRARISRKASE